MADRYDKKGLANYCKSLGGEFEEGKGDTFDCHHDDKDTRKQFWKDIENFKEVE